VVIYTIGHSNLPMEQFLRALERYAIGQVVDVRSHPYSRFAPWANPTQLKRELLLAGIDYRFAGNQLGGQPDQRSLRTPAGAPDYDKMSRLPAYQQAIQDLVDAAGRQRVALLCSEGDPLRCHRERLIGRSLRSRGCEVNHIMPDGDLLAQQQGTLL
jgi:uncharacterized protein (DUF488 family)